MIKFCVRLVQRWLPEPFIFAILLTFVAALVAMPLCHQTPLEVVEHWGGGVWNLLAFAMQMSLVLVCGSTLAAAPVVKRAIDAMARLPKSAPAAIALVTVVSALACCLNWGFGLIVGVVFAKAIARQRSDVDYRLLIASAYSGFVVWHAGISGSIPLTMATPGEALSMATNGALTDPVPLAKTIFDWHNLATVLFVIIGITVANTLMHPKKGILTIDPALLKDDEKIKTEVPSSAKTPAQRLENSKLLSWLVALMLVAYLVIHLVVRGAGLDLGGVIMISSRWDFYCIPLQSITCVPSGKPLAAQRASYCSSPSMPASWASLQASASVASAWAASWPMLASASAIPSPIPCSPSFAPQCSTCLCLVAAGTGLCRHP